MHAACEVHGEVTVACPRCAGAAGGKVGGQSRSPRRLAACRENARRARGALRQRRDRLDTALAQAPVGPIPPAAAVPGRIHDEIKAAIERSRLAAESWTRRR